MAVIWHAFGFGGNKSGALVSRNQKKEEEKEEQEEEEKESIF